MSTPDHGEAVDLARLRLVIELLHSCTDIPVTLLDADHEPVLALNWRELCPRCREVSAQALAHCRDNHEALARSLAESGRFAGRCAHGLEFVARRVPLPGRPAATVLLGQFAYADSPPDPEEARRRAQECGYPEEEYVAAISAMPVVDRERVAAVEHFLAAGLDLAAALEQIIAERADSERRYHTLVENIPGAVYRCEVQAPWRVTVMSEGVRAVTGYAAGDFLRPGGLEYAAIVHPQDLPGLVAEVAAAVAAYRCYEFEYRILHASGAVRWVHERGQAIYGEAGQPQCLDGVIIDISARKEAEAQLRESQEVAWALLNANQDAAFLVDRQGQLLAVNEGVARGFGVTADQMRDTCLCDWLPPEVARSHRSYLDQVFRRGEPLRGEDEWAGHTYSHSFYPVRDETGAVTQAALFSRDITYLKRAEEAQRLAALGQLAGGVAHEFNNLLCSLWMNADLAATRGGLEDYQALAELVREGARRGGAICEDLMGFARPAPPRRRPLAPQVPLEAALDVASRQLANAGIKVRRRYDAGEALINADAGQLQQVYVNLLMNACQAMAEGGELTLETALVITDEGPVVQTLVRDNGTGIPPENLPHIFEPFFTTKGALSQSEVPGSGLGLAVSHGLVTAHEGTISARSEWGQGTVVEVQLPALLLEQSHALATEAAAPTEQEWAGRGLRLLLAEDENPLREIIAEGLHQRGLEVVTADDAPQAVAALHGPPFDVVVTDLLMPGGGGLEVMRYATSLDPTPRLLVITGKIGSNLVEELHAAGAQLVLHKPFGLQDIVHAVAEVLRSP